MQEEVDQKTIVLSMKVGKLTAQVLQAALKKYLQHRAKGKTMLHHGQQSLKQLKKHGAALSNTEITEANIGAFKPCAKKYGVELTSTKDGTIRGNLYELDYQQHFRHVIDAALPVSVNQLFYEHGSRDIPAEQYFDRSPDWVFGDFQRYEAQPHNPAVLQEALQQEQHGRKQARPGDFKAHITALHDSRIETEAQRIVDKLKDLSAPNSPNKTHFMVEISPHFDALASTKDNDRFFAMLPYKSLCFTGIKDRHGVYAMIGKDERRDVSIRRPRPSIRKQLTDSKQAASPKMAAARTKKNELEV